MKNYDLSDLNKLNIDVIDFDALKAAGLIRVNTKYIKLIASGKLERAITVRNIPISAGARKAIEAANGKIEA